MQRGDGGHGLPEHHDLTGHEHALVGLPGLVHGQQFVADPLDALAGEPEPADVEPLKPLPDLPVGDTLLAQLVLEGGEVRADGAARAAGGVARRRLQQIGPLRVEDPALEERLDGAAAYRLLGEQVGRAHQYAERDTGARQRGGQRGGHRGRPLVVDATGEEHGQFTGGPVRRLGAFGAGLGEEVEQHLGLRLPQREAVARPDVAAALGALEDEPARTRRQELAQQPRRRHMQEGGDALRLQRRRLGRPAACDDRVRGPQLPYDVELGRLDVLIGETEHSHAPLGVAECVAGAFEHRAGPVGVREREGEERQTAPGSHGGGERGLVADARHRPLGDGQSGTERTGAGRSGGQRGGGRVVGERGGHGGPDAAHGLGDRGPALGEGRGQEGVLAERDELGTEIVRADP